MTVMRSTSELRNLGTDRECTNRTEHLVVVADAPHDSSIDDSIEEHAERVDVQGLVLRVLPHHRLYVSVLRAHCLQRYVQRIKFHLGGGGGGGGGDGRGGDGEGEMGEGEREVGEVSGMWMLSDNYCLLITQ